MTDVAVVVTAFNQAHVVGEAIESAAAQDGASVEIVVVDDGSTDGTAELVAREHPGVKVVRQPNRGPAAARVAGLDASSAEYVVFLDGDDRLAPGGLERSLRVLAAEPALGFVSGRCVHIDADGTRLPTEIRPAVTADHYRELLARAYVYPPGAAMFRRSALDAVRPLNVSRRYDGAEDLELFLRVARSAPVADHDDVVVEYRRHGANFASSHPERVLRSVLRVLRDERRFTEGDRVLERARRDGIAHWQQVFGYEIAQQARAQLGRREWRGAAGSAAALVRLASPAIARALGRKARRRLGRASSRPAE